MGRFTGYTDWLSVVFVSCLGAFGLFILLTIDRSLFWQQLVLFVVAFIVMWIFSRIDGTFWLWAAPYLYILSLLFLVASYLGPNIRGATRWLLIGPFQIQPSEIVKPFVLLFFAWLLRRYSARRMIYLPIHLLSFLVPFFLIFRQPDLGTGLVYAGSWIAMMLSAGLSLPLVALAGVMSIGGLPLFWQLLVPYQKSRVFTFLDPALDPRGAGYNAIQAMIAVGSGQWFGRGLGRGTQSHLRFLPEFHTDFIFATLVEELGFFGGVLLFLCYAGLFWRMILPLVRGAIQDVVPFVYSVGLFAMLLVQVFINSGMNMGLIPITGITLPLVSYGGSSLVSIGMGFGILWAIRKLDSRDVSVAFQSRT